MLSRRLIFNIVGLLAVLRERIDVVLRALIALLDGVVGRSHDEWCQLMKVDGIGWIEATGCGGSHAGCCAALS